ncbi:MAG: TRAP transporter substrate-binding protein [Burkholderiaceae bacterium]
MRRLFATLGAVALVVASTPVHAEKMILKFGHVGDPGSLYEGAVNEFARIANAKLGDKAEVQVFGSSQLGKDKEMLQKLKLGQITFSLPSSIMSSVADEFGVFEMPYIIKSREHMMAVQKSIGESVFNKAAKAKGYRILTYFENGFRHITNNTRPINKPEDLAGIKLRTPNGEWRVKMFQSYGANPTPMAFSDVFTALKTGVIDGQENPYAQIYGRPSSRRCKSACRSPATCTRRPTSPCRKSTSPNCPADIQKALQEAADESADHVQMAADLENKLLGELKAAGMQVNEADKDAFIAASRRSTTSSPSTVEGGPALIEAVRAVAR